MPKFLIEREIPGAGDLTRTELRDISRASCETIAGMATRIQWLESYVTADKLYCLYLAPDSNAVMEHARLGGFPANRISQVTTMIDPTSAE